MVKITLPDQRILQYDAPVSGEKIALDIGAKLLKDAMAIKVNGHLQDLNLEIDHDAEISIVTINSSEGLEILRHDAAHVLAQSVKELFPDCQITIGPVIADGFFYDIATKTPFTMEDLEKIEQKMREIVARDDKIVREVWDRNEAIAFFKSQKEFYKAEIISSIPENEKISLYRQGDFIDLCRGPHAPSTGKLRAFKLMKLAGAYWRGDSKNEMLQRIYGTAFATEKELKQHLTMIEEAEKRDHRKLGKELGLFHIQEEAAGMVFWHEKGWTIYRQLENFIRKKIIKDGYFEVKTPILVNRALWEKSGHWEKFKENMFISESEEKIHALKPMNCPCHVQIFKQNLKSYRDLPLRMAEFGTCHRNEPSGSLHGLMRVRGFAQDDAHIFCTEEQITSETIKFCKLLTEIYAVFGFNEIKIKFSDRPAVRAGSDEIWDKSEGSLKEAVKAAGFEVEMNPGEGAFYGPKLEFVLTDAIGRHWQCGTLQVDFVLPERLDASYIGADGAKHRPVMLHRAILGSFERFIGILIEQFSGKMPLWLAPIQVAVTTITNEIDSYAAEINQKLLDSEIRSIFDASSDKISYKIREHSNAKIPYILTVGEKEQNLREVSVRKLGENYAKSMKFDEFLEMIRNESKMPA